MNIPEKDINFSVLSPNEFEELCFDLILDRRFENVSWRQGSYDDGRDIEAWQTVVNSLTDSYRERWFFECKRHMKGVSVEDLCTKIAWADSEDIQHFVFITSSHITTPCLRWISEIAPQKKYRIHNINGVMLKRLILTFPKIYNKYFSTPAELLFLESKNNWLVHDIMPSRDTVYILLDNLKLESLNNADKCYLVYLLYNKRPRAITKEKHNAINIKIDYLIEELKKMKENISNSSPLLARKNVLVTSSNVSFGEIEEGDHCISANLTIKRSSGVISAQYFLFNYSPNEALEFFIIKSSDFCVDISYINKSSKKYSEDVSKFLMDNFVSNDV